MKTVKTFDTFTETYTYIEVEDEIANAMELFDALEKEDDIAYWKAQKSAKKPWYFKNYQEADYVGDVIKEFLEDNSIEDLQAMAPETIDLIVGMLFPDVRPENMQDASEVYANRRKAWSATYIDEFIPRSKSKIEILAKVGEDTYAEDEQKAKKSRELNRMVPNDMFNGEALTLYGDCKVLKANALAVKRAAISHNGNTEEDAEARKTYMGEYKKLAKELARKYEEFKMADSTQDVFAYDMQSSHDIPHYDQYEDNTFGVTEYFFSRDFRESSKESYKAKTWSEGQKELAREKRRNEYMGFTNPPRFIRLDSEDKIIRKKYYTWDEFNKGVAKLKRERIEERNKPRFSMPHLDNLAIRDIEIVLSDAVRRASHINRMNELRDFREKYAALKTAKRTRNLTSNEYWAYKVMQADFAEFYKK